jgi:putative transposase
VSGVWSSSIGKPVWGMQVVLLLGTDGKWKVPVGIRLWRSGGPSKVELAIGLLSQARRRGLRPAYVLFDSWYAAGQILNLLGGWGWQYVTRLKANRLLDKESLRTKWPHRQVLRGHESPLGGPCLPASASSPITRFRFCSVTST